MTVWVLFVWLNTGPLSGPSAMEPHPMLSFKTQKECLEQATPYKKASCVKVDVSK